MPSPDSLRRRVDKALSRFNLTDRQIFLRRVERTGGDSLTGRGITALNNDTLLDPPPFVEVIGVTSPLVINAGSMIRVGDYSLFLSANVLSRDDLLNRSVSVVFAANSQEEECSVVDYLPLVFGGQDVAFIVYVRGKRR